jgi:hypothetical protein
LFWTFKRQNDSDSPQFHPVNSSINNTFYSFHEPSNNLTAKLGKDIEERKAQTVFIKIKASILNIILQIKYSKM